MMVFMLLFTVIASISCKNDNFLRLEVPFGEGNVSVLSNSFDIGKIQCAASCAKHPCCLSYAYEAINDVCVLLDQTWNSGSSRANFTTDEQWFYYERDVRRNCPSDWKYFMGFCFKYHIDIKEWNEAQETCRESDSFLAEIYCSRIGDFTESMVNTSDSSYFWLGGTDMQNEGVWKWSHQNRVFNYLNWDTSQPDDYKNGEDCLEGVNNSKWNDFNCTAHLPFICQKDAT